MMRITSVALIFIFFALSFFLKSSLRRQDATVKAFRVPDFNPRPAAIVLPSASPNQYYKRKHFSRNASESQEQLAIREQQCWEEIEAQKEPTSDFIRLYLRSSTDRVGQWFFEQSGEIPDFTVPTAEASAANLFLLGLAKAALLEGSIVKNIERDDQAALSLLARAHFADPENSAPLLYMALLQKRLGLQSLESDTLAQVADSRKYDSYVGTIGREIYSFVRSPSDIINAAHVWSTLPTPSYGAEVYSYINSRKLSIVVEQMASPLLESALEPVHPGSFTIEPVIAVGFLRKLQPTRAGLPSPDQVRAYIRGESRFFDITAFRPQPDSSGKCSLESVQPLLWQLQSLKHVTARELLNSGS